MYYVYSNPKNQLLVVAPLSLTLYRVGKLDSGLGFYSVPISIFNTQIASEPLTYLGTADTISAARLLKDQP